MNSKQKQALVGFKKARSLLDTIIKMLEEERYCVDIMQQNLAAIGLLRSAHETLMENHLKTCFSRAIATKNKQKKARMIKEILQVARLYNK